MRTANPLDQFFLVSFNDRAELTSGFTSSVDELQNRMMFTASKGRTALLDAVYLGLSQMRGAHNGKRALLIISDGGDNHSRYNENDVKNYLKEADCQLYAIGIFDPIGIRSRTTEELEGPSLLSEMTEMTGGRVFPVGNLGELPDIAAKIGMELRNQYVLGYKSSNAQHNGTWRKIKVKLRAAQRASSPQRLRQDRILRAEPVAAAALPFSCWPFFWPPRVCSLASGAFAQQQAPVSPIHAPHRRRPRLRLLRRTGPQGAYSIKSQVSLVVLHASVLNDRSVFVPGLDRKKISEYWKTRSSRSFPSSSRKTCRSASAWWWTTAAACATSVRR